VIFGVAANVSISKLFMAGIVPGHLLGVSLVVHLVVAGAQGNHRPAAAQEPARKCWRPALATWALVLPVIIVVGLKMGVFTPTEAAVVAAVYALFVSTVIYRELT
jgi:TRAP-type C4-dicarboxylate transport system permease large subunit